MENVLFAAVRQGLDRLVEMLSCSWGRWGHERCQYWGWSSSSTSSHVRLGTRWPYSCGQSIARPAGDRKHAVIWINNGCSTRNPQWCMFGRLRFDSASSRIGVASLLNLRTRVGRSKHGSGRTYFPDLTGTVVDAPLVSALSRS